MTLKSVNLIVNNYCNSKCSSCNIWKNKDKGQLTPEDIKKLFSHDDFLDVIDVSVTGGEPLLLRNIDEILGAITRSALNLNTLFLNHNGTFPQKAIELVTKYSSNVEQLYLCLSLEGPEDLHNQIRGINCFSRVIEILEGCDNLNIPKFKSMISTTLQSSNCNSENLEYLLNLSKKYDSEFTFRFMGVGNYYNNEMVGESIGATKQQICKVIDFLKDREINQRYLDVLRDYYYFNKSFLLIESSGKIICQAGETSVSVFPDQDIYPCIFSNQSIGNVQEGIIEKNIDLRNYASCPCEPTECVIYPLLE